MLLKMAQQCKFTPEISGLKEYTVSLNVFRDSYKKQIKTWKRQIDFDTGWSYGNYVVQYLACLPSCSEKYLTCICNLPEGFNSNWKINRKQN